ncbi:MAG TPA: hypothetical protein VFU47_16810, partial [Armatimonadota bacterium]|nr:hypothetical protein [Armatimonadota bacterium]
MVWLLVVAAGLFTRAAAPPARAQAGHVHQWTAGDAPRLAEIRVAHLNGRSVTYADPALPCEVVRIDGWIEDRDLCTAPGCPYPGGVYQEWEGSPGNLHLTTIKDWVKQNTRGHFVRQDPLHPPDRWVNLPGDADNTCDGLPIFFRVARDELEGLPEPREKEIGVSGIIEDGGSPFDDPPADRDGTGFWVRGERCW